MDIQDIIRIDSKHLHDEFMRVVAYQLHFFDVVSEHGEIQFTYNGLQILQEESIARYRNDRVFNNKVKSMVSQLMQSVEKERDARLLTIKGKNFKINEIL
jgi:hypothetical protein